MSDHAIHDTHDAGHATELGRSGSAAAGHTNHRRDYFRIFWALLVLTILEVGVAYWRALPRQVMATLMVGMALTKASLVGLFYMHLKYEKKSLMWLAFIPLPLAGIYAAALMLDAHGLIRAITLPWK